MQRSQSVKCTTNRKNTNSCFSRFSRNFNTFKLHQPSNRADTDRVWWCYTSAVSPDPPPSLAWFDSATDRIPPIVGLLYCWWWRLLSRSESQMSFSPRPLSHGPLRH